MYIYIYFPLAHRPDSGSWPTLTGLVITLVVHTTLDRTPLDEWSARRRDLYLTTQRTQQTNVHAAGGIRTRNPNKRSTADPCLNTRGHSDRLKYIWCTQTASILYKHWLIRRHEIVLKILYLNFTPIFCYPYIRRQVKQSHYRPGQSLRVPGGWGSQISKTISTWRWQGCQPFVPAAFIPRKYSLYSFLLEAESTPGPQCGRKNYVDEEFQWHHRELNPRPSGL